MNDDPTITATPPHPTQQAQAPGPLTPDLDPAHRTLTPMAPTSSSRQPAPDLHIARLPIGPIIRTSNTPHGTATASFDQSLTYRYRLARTWNPRLPRLAFCMLNPSTADEQQLDPTVRRCWGYATAWQAGTLEVVNAYALRSTDPKALYTHPNPIGPDNDHAIIAAGEAADLLIVAWGTHATHLNRNTHLTELLADHHIPAAHLGLTAAGHPRHPLYLKADTWPTWWNPTR